MPDPNAEPPSDAGAVTPPPATTPTESPTSQEPRQRPPARPLPLPPLPPPPPDSTPVMPTPEVLTTTPKAGPKFVDLSQSSITRPLTSKLSSVKIGESAKLLILFTPGAEIIDCHYLDSPTHGGLLQCTGDGCLLCGLYRSQHKRYLLPVFDPTSAEIMVLQINENEREGALLPQLRPLFRRINDGERLMVEIRRKGRYEHEVDCFPVPASANDGAAVIARFLAKYVDGDLATVIPTMTPAELARIPSVAEQARLKGFPL